MLYEDEKHHYDWSLEQGPMKPQEHDSKIAALILVTLAAMALLCFLLAGLRIREIRAGTEPPVTSPLPRALARLPE
jgi:hypothetical protein